MLFRSSEVEGSPRTEQKPTKENPFTNEFFGERPLLEGVATNNAHLLNAKRNPLAKPCLGCDSGRRFAPSFAQDDRGPLLVKGSVSGTLPKNELLYTPPAVEYI